MIKAIKQFIFNLFHPAIWSWRRSARRTADSLGWCLEEIRDERGQLIDFEVTVPMAIDGHDLTFRATAFPPGHPKHYKPKP